MPSPSTTRGLLIFPFALLLAFASACDEGAGSTSPGALDAGACRQQAACAAGQACFPATGACAAPTCGLPPGPTGTRTLGEACDATETTCTDFRGTNVPCGPCAAGFACITYDVEHGTVATRTLRACMPACDPCQPTCPPRHECFGLQGGGGTCLLAPLAGTCGWSAHDGGASYAFGLCAAGRSCSIGGFDTSLTSVGVTTTRGWCARYCTGDAGCAESESCSLHSSSLAYGTVKSCQPKTAVARGGVCTSATAPCAAGLTCLPVLPSAGLCW